jgi:TatD DNase family protein
VPFDFPVLDCHAHIDPTVTRRQVATLEGAQVFAMTRTLDDAEVAISNTQDGIYWAIGAHPGVRGAVDSWDLKRFESLAQTNFLVGEVGLHRRGSSAPHRAKLVEALAAAHGRIVSLHSAGRVREVLDAVEQSGNRGVVLHWFLGDVTDIRRAIELGCYFSVNAAMPDDALKALPYERVLPETDFPASRGKTGAARPGDISALEATVARLTRLRPERVRRNWYITLGSLIRDASVVGIPKRLVVLCDEAQHPHQGVWQE